MLNFIVPEIKKHEIITEHIDMPFFFDQYFIRIEEPRLKYFQICRPDAILSDSRKQGGDFSEKSQENFKKETEER